MAFPLYQTGKLEMRYRRMEELKPAGAGLIPCARSVGWTITISGMLAAGEYDPNRNALVIHAAPRH